MQNLFAGAVDDEEAAAGAGEERGEAVPTRDEGVVRGEGDVTVRGDEVVRVEE